MKPKMKTEICVMTITYELSDEDAIRKLLEDAVEEGEIEHAFDLQIEYKEI